MCPKMGRRCTGKLNWLHRRRKAYAAVDRASTWHESAGSLGKSFLTLFPGRHVGEVRPVRMVNAPSKVGVQNKRVRCYDLARVIPYVLAGKL